MPKKIGLLLFILTLTAWQTITSDFSSFNWINWLTNNLLFWLGAVLGFYFILFEKLWQIFYLYTDRPSSIWVKKYLRSWPYHNIRQFILYLWQTDFSGQNRSMINSLLFHLAWAVLAFFTITSTAVNLGKGLVIGLGFYLLWQAWASYLRSWEEFRAQACWQIGRELSQPEVKTYLYILTGLSLFLLTLYI